MPLNQVALVSQTEQISSAELSQVSAALQKQVSRDFGPLWSVNATVDAFDRLEDVPLGYWPVIIRDDIDQPGAAGFHQDPQGQPMALVQYSSSWSLTASHETLEMLADPFGNRLVAGDSPQPGQGRVQLLVEVCDPSEGAQFAYTVNGILVSDFYTPQFLDPVKTAGVRYSYTGAIQAPRTVLDGGYLSWIDPVSGHLWQWRLFGQPDDGISDRGPITIAGSLRETVDRLTPVVFLRAGLDANNSTLLAALGSREAGRVASNRRASVWNQHLARLTGRGGFPPSTVSLPHHRSPLSQGYPLAHVSGTLQHVFPNPQNHHGADHQHFQVLIQKVIDLQGSSEDINGQTVFVAVRFGDNLGLSVPIPNLAQGQEIELQGEYIDAAEAYAAPDNDPPLPVLHFTHKPYGFVKYQGQNYS